MQIRLYNPEQTVRGGRGGETTLSGAWLAVGELTLKPQTGVLLWGSCKT